jgi:hypothetical protein
MKKKVPMALHHGHTIVFTSVVGRYLSRVLEEGYRENSLASNKSMVTINKNFIDVTG